MACWTWLQGQNKHHAVPGSDYPMQLRLLHQPYTSAGAFTGIHPRTLKAKFEHLRGRWFDPSIAHQMLPRFFLERRINIVRPALDIEPEDYFATFNMRARSAGIM